MGTGISFIMLTLVYNILLICVYFYKKRLNTIENKIYKLLIVSNFIGILLEIGCRFTIPIMDKFPILNLIITKLYLVYLVLWAIIFTIYVLVISFNVFRNNNLKINNRFRKLLIYSSLFYIFTIVAIFILPLYYYNDGNEIYSFGPSAEIIYYFVAVDIFICFISVIVNRHVLLQKKYFPVISFLIIGSLSSVVQSHNPELLLTTSVETFITFLMYFTIENPDMKMIEQLNVERDRADKANKAKTDFLSNMSHEIRTPLNAIVGFSELLGEENLPESSKSLVSDIIISSENLIEIVNGVLDISKIEADKLEIISTEYEFKKIFDEMVLLAKGRLGDKGLEFLYEYDESIPPFLYGDATRIKQIGVNLLTNAIKYTKEGSVKFNISSVINNNVCRLIMSVEDTGIGIKREDIDKLFTKFERLGVERNTTVEGTGLGLAICKKLIELMGGKIYVQSVFGKGSKFTAVIDQKIVKGKIKEEVKPLVIDSSKIAGKKVLVVDDNELNIKVATRLLAKFNLDIDSVNSGALCIEKVNSNKYDLILLDDMMPKMSGTDTLIELKKINEFSTPTVVLTANAISGMREKYLSSGFDDYLSKPIENKELNRVIQKYLS